MVVDYEAAWHRLAETIAGKPQHGREGLMVSMAQIAAECRVPAGELSRMLRLYGVEVERTRAIAAESSRSESGAFVGGTPSPADVELSGHHRSEDDHDGRRIRRDDGRGRAGVAGRAVTRAAAGVD